MRAVLWSGVPYNVTVQDVPRPQINNSNDALVRMTAAAICGTDLHIYHGSYGSLNVPYVLGHEGVGIVEEVGDGVSTLSPGQHVVVPDVYDTGAINMMTGEPEAQLGGGPGLGLDYGSFYGCQGMSVHAERRPNGINIEANTIHYSRVHCCSLRRSFHYSDSRKQRVGHQLSLPL